MDAPVGNNERIAVPAPVGAPQPHPFPLIATVAPVVVSVAIFLVTKSPFALIFAALGPAVAIASVADARIQSRRRERSERARFARELDLSREQIAANHDRERLETDLDAPSASGLLGRGDHDPDRWASRIDTVRLTLGRGRTPSAIALDIAPGYGEQQAQLRELSASAAFVDDSAVSSAVHPGIAVVGGRVLAGAVARGFILQLAALLSPATHQLVIPIAIPGHWLNHLPHRRVVDDTLDHGEVRFRSAEGEVRVVVAPTLEDVPSGIRLVISIEGASRIVRHPDRSRCGPIVAEFVSREQSVAWARRLASLAGPHAVSLEPELPESADFAALAAAPAVAGTLSAPLGLTGSGIAAVDLVRDGPHAVVGGTTGSGKSELLISWVVALASRYSPDDVTFLLVDFKGGASFAPLDPLPHVVGVISDLDELAAARALESLEAEVRYRERTLAAAAVRSIDELGSGLPRLVIMVDEYASLVSGFPDLHHLFSDLAARGRSLGMHLVLCTQRPAGVIRDAVLANSGLRISLRVNNRADSQAVIDTDAAAALPADRPGRAIVAVAGRPVVTVQVPIASAEDCGAAASLWPGFSPRRPWRDPLPTRIELDALGASPGGFGLADHPHEQAQPVATWEPERHGHLIAIGAGRSGKSTLLRTLAAATGGLLVANDPEAAWDTVAALVADIRRGPGERRVLLIDDLDALVARYSDDHGSAFVEALGLLLREGPGAGVGVALAVQRLTSHINPIATLCDSRLLLRLSTRQDHVIAGGTSDTFVPNAPAGSGSWAGHPVQVAVSDAEPAVASADPPRAFPEETVAVVSTAPREFAERSRRAGVPVVELGPGAGNPSELVVSTGVTHIVGDPDAWTAHWGALTTVATTTPVVFDRVALSDFRALTRSRVVPPPIASHRGIGLLLHRGSVARVVLPHD